MISDLATIKNALGITGDFQDASITPYIDEVEAFIIDSGVLPSVITPGLVARGVSDLWNYGAGEGKFSEYFLRRVIQLAYKK